MKKKEKALKEITLPIGAHNLAIRQARAHADVARKLSPYTLDANHPENLLTYLVNAGLGLELYLKALMIAGRCGRVTKGHSLQVLYAEFPSLLRQDLEARYSAGHEWRTFSVTLVALTMTDAPVPPKVPQTPTPVPPFGTFPLAMQSLDKIFEEARYFFETVHTGEWSIFEYAPEAIDAAMAALDGTYERFKAGGFR